MLDELKAQLESQFSLSPILWGEMSMRAKQIDVRKNEILIPYRSRIRAAHIIISGSFKQSIIDSSGKQASTWFFSKDICNVATCLDSYILNEHTKYEVIALEDSVVFQIQKESVDNWADRSKEFNRFYREDIMRSFFLATEIRAQMVSNSPKDFIRYLWTNYPYILKKVPSKYMAEFIGITPEWFSKLNKIIVNESATTLN
ncbi:MAG: cyclic nucleotide-binding domain-containing protein [Bacteroidota bacterium]